MKWIHSIRNTMLDQDLCEARIDDSVFFPMQFRDFWTATLWHDSTEPHLYWQYLRYGHPRNGLGLTFVAGI
jgi:hypothetical protein